MNGFVLAIFVILFSTIGWKFLEKRSRSWRIEEASQSLSGCVFEGEKDDDFDDTFKKFEVLRQGHSRLALQRFSCPQDEFVLQCGDFSWTLQQRRQRMSYCLFRVSFSRIQLLIRREGYWDDLVDWLGWDDIDFPRRKELSETFHVQSNDARQAKHLMSKTGVAETLLSHPNNVVVDIEDGHMLLWHAGDVWTTGEFIENVNFGKKLLMRFQS